MTESKVLLVYFSRSGITSAVATAICRALEQRGLSCDLEPLTERTNRRGILGFMRSGREALFDSPAKLEPLVRDPEHYDLVVVGTPVWGSSPSTPVRAFLRQNASKLKAVAFFMTHGSTGRERTLSALARLAGKAPAAELAIRENELRRGEHLEDVQSFAGAIADRLLRRAPAVARAPARMQH